jgi:hypothetical protein
MRKSFQTVSELVDGVVRHRQGAVSTRIRDGELVVGVELLAGVDGEDGRFAVVQLYAAAVGVENVFGINKVAVVLNQPVDPV